MQEVIIGLGREELTPDQISSLEIDIMQPGFIDELSKEASHRLFGDPLNFAGVSTLQKGRAELIASPASNPGAAQLNRRYTAEGFAKGQDSILCTFILFLREFGTIDDILELPDFQLDDEHALTLPVEQETKSENNSFNELTDRIQAHMLKIMRGPFSEDDLLVSYSQGFEYGGSFAIAMLGTRCSQLAFEQELKGLMAAAGSLE